MKKVIASLILFISCLVSCNPQQKTDTGFINAGKFRIYYEAQGDGSPVLLLHAGFQDHHMWAPQIDVLKENHRIFTIDMPGHGKTTGYDTITLIADVMKIILDSLHIGKASLVGLSYGASCATDMVLAYPDRVDKVVLVSPGLTGWDKVLKPDSISLRYFALLDSAFAKKDDLNTAEVFTQVWCDGPFRKPGEVNKKVRENILATTLENLRQHDNDSWSSFSNATAAEKAGEIKKRVLIVYGDKDISIIEEASNYLHGAIAGSDVIIIKDVAHMLNMEDPDEFNEILESFLE